MNAQAAARNHRSTMTSSKPFTASVDCLLRDASKRVARRSGKRGDIEASHTITLWYVVEKNHSSHLERGRRAKVQMLEEAPAKGCLESRVQLGGAVASYDREKMMRQ